MDRVKDMGLGDEVTKISLFIYRNDIQILRAPLQCEETHALSVERLTSKKKGGTGLILTTLLPVIILSQITLKYRFFFSGD